MERIVVSSFVQDESDPAIAGGVERMVRDAWRAGFSAE